VGPVNEPTSGPGYGSNLFDPACRGGNRPAHAGRNPPISSCDADILNCHPFTSIGFNLGMRFLLTFAQNALRIKVFRLAERVSRTGFGAICETPVGV